MCPPACTDTTTERTVKERGLTGHLISATAVGLQIGRQIEGAAAAIRKRWPYSVAKICT